MQDTFVTVTRDGRTIVDANKLYEKKEVKEFIEAIKKIYVEGGESRKSPRRPRSTQSAKKRRLSSALG